MNTPKASRWNRSIVWIVLLVGLMMTATATLYVKANVERTADQDFISRCNKIHKVISDRLDDHARILLAGEALFFASDVVTREEWRTFTQHQQFEKQLPGIQGIGFSLLLPRSELTRHIQEIRNEGFPEYTVKPEGDREIYSSIIYLEPFSGRNLRAFGYDMLPEPVRREAMERARDTNSAALSGKVVLVQETNEEVQAGTLMYVPVYRKGMPTESVAERRAAIHGWVYSPYRMNDLMQGMLGDDLETAQQLHLQVFDGVNPSPQSLLYECQPERDKNPEMKVRFTRQMTVDFKGHRWTLRFTQTGGGFLPMEYTSVWFTLGGCTLITFLLFFLFQSLLNTRASAQRMAEELSVELRESEEKHRLLVKHSHDIIYMLTVKGMFTFVSPAWSTLLGHPENQVVGQPFQKFVHPEDIGRCEAFLRRIIETGQPQPSIDYRVQHVNGTWRWHASNIIPLKDKEGTILGVEGSATDITERKQAEEEIKRQASLISSLLDSIPDIIFFKDMHGIYLGCNPSFVEFVGRSKEEVIGKTDYDLFDKEIADSFKENDKRMLELREARHNEEWITYPDGRKKLIDTLKTPYRGPDGTLIGILGISRDITERKRVEEALAFTRKKLELALQSAQMGVWQFNFSEKKRIFDKQTCHLLGFNSVTFGGSEEEFFAVVHPEDREKIKAAFKQTMERDILYEPEYRVIWTDGSIHSIAVRAELERDPQGNPQSLNGLLWDITESKKTESYALEAAAAKAAAETAREKAAEIEKAYKELQEAKDLLVQSSKLSAIGELSSGVAHELNNPLAGILGIARGYMNHKNPEDDEYKDLKEIVNAGERMAKIIRELLDFARPSSREMTEMNCNDMIEDALNFSQKAMIGTGVEVQKNYGKNLPRIKGDQNRLQQVVVAIMSNAFDAMQKKGTLKISTRAIVEDGDNFVEMEFMDSGCGIKKEDLARIFDPFFTTKRPGKGTGLGLSVTYSIIKEHHGKILVESPPAGQETGASFRVRLPAVSGSERK